MNCPKLRTLLIWVVSFKQESHRPYGTHCEAGFLAAPLPLLPPPLIATPSFARALALPPSPMERCPEASSSSSSSSSSFPFTVTSFSSLGLISGCDLLTDRTALSAFLLSSKDFIRRGSEDSTRACSSNTWRMFWLGEEMLEVRKWRGGGNKRGRGKESEEKVKWGWGMKHWGRKGCKEWRRCKEWIREKNSRGESREEE